MEWMQVQGRLIMLTHDRPKVATAMTMITGFACVCLSIGGVVAQPASSERLPKGQAERVKELTARLHPISQEQGGGFLVDSEVSGLRDEDLADIAKIPAIRYLHDNGFGPSARAQFGKLTELEALSTSFAGYVTDEDLRCLQQLKLLEVLALRSTVTRPEPLTSPGRSAPSFGAVSLKPLARMSRLRELELSSDGLSDEALVHVGAVPELLSLTLEGHFTSDGLKSLSRLKSLRQLSLDGNFDDNGLVHLAQLTNLESLVLLSDRLTGTGLVNLSKLPKLRMCRLGRLRATMTLAPLKNWPTLEALNLADGSMTDGILLTLPATNQIKSLSLHGAPVTDRGLVAISRLENIEELDLIFTAVTDDGLETVASLPRLRALCLGEGGTKRLISEAGLRKLAGLPLLERLDLRYVRFKDVDLQILAIPSLTMLHIEDTSQAESLRRLHGRLPRLARPSSRVVIKASLFNESNFSRYNIYANRMEVEW